MKFLGLVILMIGFNAQAETRVYSCNNIDLISGQMLFGGSTKIEISSDEDSAKVYFRPATQYGQFKLSHTLKKYNENNFYSDEDPKLYVFFKLAPEHESGTLLREGLSKFKQEFTCELTHNDCGE
jgi:hypothetical protein